MREIKFRAWEEVNKVMHYNFQFIKSGELPDTDWIVFTSDKHKLNSVHHPFKDPFPCGQFKIMEYTGKQDNDNTDIYEGDILKTFNKDMYIVSHSTETAMYRCYIEGGKGQNIELWHLLAPVNECVVVGNIHDNPEFLNNDMVQETEGVLNE